jgi:hypothetical protein
MNNRSDGQVADGNLLRYWLIGSGSDTPRWDNWSRNNIIAIGYGVTRDLSHFSKDELRRHLDEANRGSPATIKACDDFVNIMKIGDIVVARKGKHEILGIGRITSDYKYDESLPDYRNIRNVDWIEKGNWPNPDRIDFPRNSLLEFTKKPNRIELRKFVIERAENVSDINSDTPPSGHGQFASQFGRFKTLIEYNAQGRPFVNFGQGIAAVWEGYKPRLREHAIGILDSNSWTSDTVGSGKILERTIESIEINEPGKTLQNNLVFWQNRYGHANRAHRAMIEARTDLALRTKIERQLFNLFNDSEDNSATFGQLAKLTYAQYPLLAYLFFLKDMDHFMPILPSTFDKAFEQLDIDLVTQRNCSWENYTLFNSALENIRDGLREVGGIDDARLIDAHSFCWMLIKLDQPEPNRGSGTNQRGTDAGHIYGPREKSVYEMMDSVLNTVRHARGQTEERHVKNKELRMGKIALELLIKELLTRQEERCALTGLQLQFRGVHNDDNLLPSLDRIDSNGHYEKGNLQVVCRFVNFWKQATDNEEFKKLIMLVRGFEN